MALVETTCDRCLGTGEEDFNVSCLGCGGTGVVIVRAYTSVSDNARPTVVLTATGGDL